MKDIVNLNTFHGKDDKEASDLRGFLCSKRDLEVKIIRHQHRHSDAFELLRDWKANNSHLLPCVASIVHFIGDQANV